jgi:hypothetical protein
VLEVVQTAQSTTTLLMLRTEAQSTQNPYFRRQRANLPFPSTQGVGSYYDPAPRAVLVYGHVAQGRAAISACIHW